MNVFDWLSALPLHDSAKPFNIIEVSFNKGSRKDYYRNNTGLILEKGEMIAVEGVSGYDVGMVSLTGELVKLQLKKYNVKDDMQMKKVIRMATEDDLNHFYQNKDREQEVMVRSRAIAKQLNLEMKICEVEIQADGKKATFFYTADNRVDFRDLIKIYASEFKVKVEMRQIGARQESGKVGGIGSCGRELCCSTWLTDFKTVNTTAARYQNLSINQTKLSGQCGRLKCCLNYELDTYMDALRVFPDEADTLETAQGVATLQKRDIFKSLMWYSFRESNKQYPLTIARVKEIKKLNKEGVKPEDLQPVELETSSTKAGVKVEMGFVNDVGQISLKTLEKGNKKKGNKPGGGSNAKAAAPQQKPQGQKQGQQQQPAKQAQPQKGGGQRPQQQAQQQPKQPQQQGGGQQKQGQQPQQKQAQPQRPKPQQNPKQGQGQQQKPNPNPDPNRQPRNQRPNKNQQPKESTDKS